MRQGGICAAACLYALDHNIDRLAEDHANAQALARGLAQVPGLACGTPETNLVYIDTSESGMDATELARRGRGRRRADLRHGPPSCPRLHPPGRVGRSRWTKPQP